METKETQPKEEVDDRGVPLANKVKELERKLQDKYEKELADTRRELQELKASWHQPEPEPEPAQYDPKAELMEFVKSPSAFLKAQLAEEERQKEMAAFQRQIPEAEAWIKSQPGYSNEDEARIFQIIQENKLNTPYHKPMERAELAWKLLNAEKRDKVISSKAEEDRREAAINKTSTEGGGKNVPRQTTPSRADLINKLAQAEKTGDLHAAIKLTSMLEDVR